MQVLRPRSVGRQAETGLIPNEDPGQSSRPTIDTPCMVVVMVVTTHLWDSWIRPSYVGICQKARVIACAIQQLDHRQE